MRSALMVPVILAVMLSYCFLRAGEPPACTDADLPAVQAKGSCGAGCECGCAETGVCTCGETKQDVTDTQLVQGCSNGSCSPGMQSYYPRYPYARPMNTYAYPVYRSYYQPRYQPAPFTYPSFPRYQPAFPAYRPYYQPMTYPRYQPSYQGNGASGNCRTS